MPRKPWKTRATNPKVSEAIQHYLTTGEDVDPPDFDVFLMTAGDAAEMRDLWEKIQAEILAGWIKAHPCSRPFAWWRWTAPQEPVAGWPGFSQAQRRRVGGAGQVEHEVSAVWDGFSFGIPCGWLTAEHVKLYGRGVALDPADPPRFESQAGFLSRHNLLSPAELRWLRNHPEALEPEAITFADDDDTQD
jgi:hypothetical protein